MEKNGNYSEGLGRRDYLLESIEGNSASRRFLPDKKSLEHLYEAEQDWLFNLTSAER